jgi:hypothetical protein
MTRKVKWINALVMTGVLTLGAAGAVAQEELDDMFDDGVKSNSKIAVGTDLFGLFSGTIHVHAAFRPIVPVRLQVGIGSTLTGSHIDLANYMNRDEFPVRDTNISAGLYYSVGLHVFPMPEVYQNFYMYFDYRSWKYTAQEVFDMKKFKGSFGCGWTMPIKYGLSFEANFGVYLGKETVVANTNFDDGQLMDYRWSTYEETGDRRSQFFNGFDFGVGINYNF